jgi:hypothetical protein
VGSAIATAYPGGQGLTESQQNAIDAGLQTATTENGSTAYDANWTPCSSAKTQVAGILTGGAMLQGSLNCATTDSYVEVTLSNPTTAQALQTQYQATSANPFLLVQVCGATPYAWIWGADPNKPPNIE